ncbi:unnamed protein product, partial [Mesorhabditis belari]|uniref:CWH43-like N-terminal domain-containing protein n=1 Tax=Mesorhabditis belari TaxID=2138241 RepID=A0AAF3FM14_9BILA
MFTKVWVFPVMFVICSLVGMYGSFFTGVFLGHFPLQMNFISAIGALPPERCIFAMFINAAVFFMAVTVYLRHRQIVEYYGHRLQMQFGVWRVCSTMLTAFAFLSAFGISLLANFPDIDVKVVHRIGSTMAFFFGLLYIWGQVVFGYIMSPAMTTKAMSHFRLLIVILATETLILYEVCVNSHIFIPADAGPRPPRKNGIRWYTPDSPYYINHMAATISEWLGVIFVDIFILTFANELQFAYLQVPRLRFINEPRRLSDATDGEEESFAQSHQSFEVY